MNNYELVLVCTAIMSYLNSTLITLVAKSLGVPIVITFIIIGLTGWLTGYAGGRIYRKLGNKHYSRLK